MAFLDNSGDIILDAVLTDTGRKRLAHGDGSFQIAKFAFGDDEVDYSLYQNANHINGAHPSGSAYYDLEILQTPILEAFTNNASYMHSKLLNIAQTNFLYLPMLKLNDTSSADNSRTFTADSNVADIYIICVDEATEGVSDAVRDNPTSAFIDSNSLTMVNQPNQGVLGGFTTNPTSNPNRIVVHHGLDTSEISVNRSIDSALRETAYLAEIDSRLGQICHPASLSPIPESFIDDDQIATYLISGRGANQLIRGLNVGDISTLAGPRDNKLVFKVRSSLDLRTSTFLFTKLGGEYTFQSRTFYYIDSIIRITGATTGYRIDIPVRFVKYKSG
tara:strand:+ start:65 stop:1060 length:996 start_codon:yes stop_codon:yes gene_type:complete